VDFQDFQNSYSINFEQRPTP